MSFRQAQTTIQNLFPFFGATETPRMYAKGNRWAETKVLSMGLNMLPSERAKT